MTDNFRFLCFLFPALIVGVSGATAQPRTLDGEMHHLRVSEEREWASFPEKPESEALEVQFEGKHNADTLVLGLHQEDVREDWHVELNGQVLGTLIRDEQPYKTYFGVPPDGLREGKNVLRVRQDGSTADDVLAGRITLHRNSPSSLLSEGRVVVTVRNEKGRERLPARVTVLTPDGTLQTLGAESGDRMAVRPGVVYTATGRASFGLPAGRYKVFAGRGPEYNLDSALVEVGKEDTVRRDLTLEKVVDTEGWIASDPHTHTLTYSGHGDATVAERVITFAGEGLDLPIATDHNAHADYEPAAESQGVRSYFTPVIGNEVTTPVGHFNVFPVEEEAPVPRHEFDRWGPLFKEIWATPDVKVAVLNHGRDVHAGFRPLDPSHFNAVTGRNRNGWPVRYNAMEVINSGAQQIDVMRLVRDWFALLNRGHQISPIGSSDSHDVNRYIVGQGRTYIRLPAQDPASIEVGKAMARLSHGRVTVSEGLFAEVVIEGGAGPGEVVRAEGPVSVEARVQGPGWVQARSVALYANGRKIREDSIRNGQVSGAKWEDSWQLGEFERDVYLVLVARGPGVTAPYWPIPKPYQHEQIEYDPEVIAVTGAVRIDADGDGSFTSARGYAEELVSQSNGDVDRLVGLLNGYDEAVSVHSAELFRERYPNRFTPARLRKVMEGADGEIRSGLKEYLKSAREEKK